MDLFQPTLQDSAVVRRLLYQTERIRFVEEKIAEVYPEKQIRCPTHLCTGQEAVPAGVCSALSVIDHVMSTHRAHGHYLAKGGDLKKMLAEIYGKKTGCSAGIGGSQHLIDVNVNFFGSTPIVGGTIPVATGLSWAAKLSGDPYVTAVFFGEGATEEGVFHESINFACLHKLPMIFVCENNLYSVYTPLKERQPNRKIADIAKAHGLIVDTGDGNNVFEVYSKTKEAVRKTRAGEGPYFLEFSTYRWREHCGPNFDNNIGYRTEEEFLSWQIKDPVQIIEKYALENCFIKQTELEDIKLCIVREIKSALEFAKNSPSPDNILTSENCYG